MSRHAYFVAGTDTGVGKTLVAAGLLAAANARGLSSLGLKPVAAGGEEVDGRFMNEDAYLLQQTASCQLDYADVNPIALQEAIAPHIAADREGRELPVGRLAEHCRRQADRCSAQFVVAEGAGGWLVPLQGSQTMADLAVALGWPVIMVVAMKLGCLNHAMLTAAAVRNAGLAIAGWVATSPEPAMNAYEANLETLRAQLDAPCIGVIPNLGVEPTPAKAAGYLDLDPLAGGLR